MNQGAPAQTETPPVSDNTSDLPSTCDLPVQGQEELYMVRAPPVPYADRSLERNRPGWQTRKPLVCYRCYVKNKHIAPNCDEDPYNFATIVRNFEALTPEERQGVPTNSYDLAKRCVEAGISPASDPSPPGPKN